MRFVFFVLVSCLLAGPGLARSPILYWQSTYMNGGESLFEIYVELSDSGLDVEDFAHFMDEFLVHNPEFDSEVAIHQGQVLFLPLVLRPKIVRKSRTFGGHAPDRIAMDPHRSVHTNSAPPAVLEGARLASNQSAGSLKTETTSTQPAAYRKKASEAAYSLYLVVGAESISVDETEDDTSAVFSTESGVGLTARFQINPDHAFHLGLFENRFESSDTIEYESTTIRYHDFLFERRLLATKSLQLAALLGIKENGYLSAASKELLVIDPTAQPAIGATLTWNTVVDLSLTGLYLSSSHASTFRVRNGMGVNLGLRYKIPYLLFGVQLDTKFAWEAYRLRSSIATQDNRLLRLMLGTTF